MSAAMLGLLLSYVAEPAPVVPAMETIEVVLGVVHISFDLTRDRALRAAVTALWIPSDPDPRG